MLNTAAQYVDGAFIGTAHEFLVDAAQRAERAEAEQQAVKRAVATYCQDARWIRANAARCEALRDVESALARIMKGER